eukprot:356183-Chlamydomonas_euryale.AAC.4
MHISVVMYLPPTRPFRRVDYGGEEPKAACAVPHPTPVLASHTSANPHLPWRVGCGDEELRAVGVGAGVGHRQHAGRMRHLEVLILKAAAVHRVPPGAVAALKVASLRKESAHVWERGLCERVCGRAGWRPE